MKQETDQEDQDDMIINLPKEIYNYRGMKMELNTQYIKKMKNLKDEISKQCRQDKIYLLPSQMKLVAQDSQNNQITLYHEDDTIINFGQSKYKKIMVFQKLLVKDKYRMQLLEQQQQVQKELLKQKKNYLKEEEEQKAKKKTQDRKLPQQLSSNVLYEKHLKTFLQLLHSEIKSDKELQIKFSSIVASNNQTFSKILQKMSREEKYFLFQRK